MGESTGTKYSGLLGIGLLIVWLLAILFLSSSEHKVFAFIGVLFVSAVMTGIFLYVNSLETELKKPSRRIVNGFYED